MPLTTFSKYVGTSLLSLAILIGSEIGTPTVSHAEHKASHKAKQKAKHKAKRKAHKAVHKQRAKNKAHKRAHKRARHHRHGKPKHWRGPPPWAPAHGYRYKHGHVYNRTAYATPFSINSGTCNRTAIGTAIGGILGGVAGSQIGKGDGKIVAILGGTVLGAIVGRTIGKAMDGADQTCVSQSLEHGRDGSKIVWRNQAGTRFQVTPLATVVSDSGRYCRTYKTTATIAGDIKVTTGTACRDAKGIWRLAN